MIIAIALFALQVAVAASPPFTTNTNGTQAVIENSQVQQQVMNIKTASPEAPNQASEVSGIVFKVQTAGDTDISGTEKNALKYSHESATMPANTTALTTDANGITTGPTVLTTGAVVVTNTLYHISAAKARLLLVARLLRDQNSPAQEVAYNVIKPVAAGRNSYYYAV